MSAALQLPRDKARVLLQDARAVELANKAQQLRSLIQAVREYPLTTDNDVAQLTDGAKEFKASLDAVEEERMSLTRPIREDEKLVNEAFRPYTSALKDMLQAIKDRLVRYHAETRAAQAELQAKASQAFQAGDSAQGVAIMAQIPIQAETPGVSMRDNWTFDVVDENAVPREFCSPDPAKIRAYVAAYKDKAAIPGVKVENRPIASVRKA
jgi:hypothetical protein